MSQSLAIQLAERLRSEPLDLVRIAGEIAERSGYGLYLVGGAVRDLLLGQANLDLDLVVEGDAVELARALQRQAGGEVLTHLRFGTAKLRRGDLLIDLATARAESYEHPGALPTVRPSTIVDDLARRDFTINAMAIHLDASNFGRLVDPFGGQEDLSRKRVRVLHDNSFVDDATRMLRAVRYEQRFDFRLEPATERLLRRDVSMLHTVSGDRTRHEVELILREPCPEKALARAEGLGLLAQIHPSLRGNGWVAEKFRTARATAHPPALGLYLSILVYHFTDQEVEDLATALKLPGATARVIRDSVRLRQSLHALETPELSPSTAYRFLEDYSPTSILACAIASDSPLVQTRLKLYLDRWRHVKPSLDGQALQRMGIPPGPRIGRMLRALLEARLDQRVRTRSEEANLVRLWMSQEK